MIVSKSKDAEPVAYTCQRLGHKTALGSSRKGNVDKGGAAAKAEMIELLKMGYPGAVTVDGPRGPALKVKRGIIEMAKESGAMIVPYTIKAQRKITFNSWDNFQLPLPFTRIKVFYGRPVDVSALSVEQGQVAVEQAMLEAHNS